MWLSIKQKDIGNTAGMKTRQSIYKALDRNCSFTESDLLGLSACTAKVYRHAGPTNIHARIIYF